MLIDVRKVSNANGRFYIHEIKTEDVVSKGNLNTGRLSKPSTSSNNNIPPAKPDVKYSKTDSKKPRPAVVDRVNINKEKIDQKIVKVEDQVDCRKMKSTGTGETPRGFAS